MIPGAFPFLEAAGAAERRWPRALATLLLGAGAALLAALAAVLVVMTVAAAISAAQGTGGWIQTIDVLRKGASADRPLVSYVFDLAVAGASSMAAAAAFLAVCARRAGRPLVSFATLSARFRWRHAVLGLVLLLPVVAAEIWLDGLVMGAAEAAPIADPGAGAADRLAYAAAAVVFLWLAALAEELLFRGWMLQQTYALTRRVLLVLAVNAIVFALAHGDLTVGGLVTRIALGLGWAWVVLRLDGIEFAAGAHLANNLGIALLGRPVTLVPAAEDGAVNSVAMLMQVATVIGLALAVEFWVRRRPIAGRASAAEGIL